MRSAGIICEYNPLHSGHAYQLARLRETGTDCIVLVMSGSFTQRGELAVADKYTRAEAALRAGADLVLELPYPYCAGSAEYFAAAGVGILGDLSVETLCFGSETGDLDFLSRAAETALSGSFRAAFAAEGKGGTGSARAYFDLLSEQMGVPEFASNDVLGTEYLKAIKKGGYPIKPLIIRREGAAYREEEIKKGGHPSATALRLALKECGKDPARIAARYAALSGLPEAVSEPFGRAISEGRAPAALENNPGAVLSFYRMHTPAELAGIAEMHGGLAERICRGAREATGLTDFLRLAATKKYTDSRVRRAILYGLTGVTEEDLKTPPAYVNVLGMTDAGRAFLAAKRRDKERRVELVTRPAAILCDKGGEKTAAFARQAALQQRAEALYTLFLPTPAPAGIYLTSRARIAGKPV